MGIYGTVPFWTEGHDQFPVLAEGRSLLDTCLIPTLEALAVSEVFGLMEQHPSATIIITTDIDADAGPTGC